VFTKFGISSRKELRAGLAPESQPLAHA
jgi:hypothetical protein